MIYLIAGNSGSGKTTQANLLRDNQGFFRVITYTTRSPRIGEFDGIDYKFISKKTFLELKKNNKLVAITEYSNNFYAIDKDELLSFTHSNKNLVLILDLDGVKEIKSKFDDVICIYLKLDDDNLISRMKKRGDSLDKITTRQKSLQDFTPYADYIIDSSKDVHLVADEILEIIKNKNGK